MNETLLWVVLLVTVVTAIVAILSLLRSGTGYQSLSQEVREELKAGRDESRAAAKELREEVSNGLRLSAESIAKTLGTC